MKKKLLVLDTSFSYEAIKERDLLDSVTSRDLEGYFDHVWSVHPFASLVTSDRWSPKYGKYQTYKINERHTFIEGKVGRFKLLKFLKPINFLISQIIIFFILSKLIKDEKITIVRSGSPLFVGLLGVALARRCNVPFVIRVGANYDKIFETTKRPIEKNLFMFRCVEKKIERFVFSRANLVAGANENNLQFALENGAKKNKSTLFRYGNLIDKRHFLAPNKRGQGHQKILKSLKIKDNNFLIYVGRLEPVKRPYDVLCAFNEIHKTEKDLKLLLVGDGSQREYLESLAIKKKIDDKVIFTGNMTQKWLSLMLPKARAVLSPHTGRALSEAALSASPIIAYDVDWQGELIETGVTGELVNYGDIDGMVKALNKILCKPSYSLQIGNKAREKTFNMMNPKLLNKHEIRQYEILLEG